MSFNQQGFGPIGGENMLAPAIWAYRTDDALNDVIAAGYFDDKLYQIENGDYVFITAAGGNGIGVLSNNGSNVDVSLIDGGGSGGISIKEVASPYTVLEADEILIITGTDTVTLGANLSGKTVYSADGCTLSITPENVPALIPAGQSYTLYYRSSTGGYIVA